MNTVTQGSTAAEGQGGSYLKRDVNVDVAKVSGDSNVALDVAHSSYVAPEFSEKREVGGVNTMPFEQSRKEDASGVAAAYGNANNMNHNFENRNKDDFVNREDWRDGSYNLKKFGNNFQEPHGNNSRNVYNNQRKDRNFMTNTTNHSSYGEDGARKNDVNYERNGDRLAERGDAVNNRFSNIRGKDRFFNRNNIQTGERTYNNASNQEMSRYKPPMLRNNNFYNSNTGFNNVENKGVAANDVNALNANSGTGNSRFSRNNMFYSNRNANIPKTTWTNRDNRRYVFENEEEIFQNARTDGGNFELFNNIPVEISGYDSENIKAVESFDDAELQLNSILLGNIKRIKYTQTTPIQKYSISAIMNKNDLIAVAQTGSGKTAGYLIPIINHMLTSGPPVHTFYENNNELSSASYYFRKVALPICLILAPTRELAVQIFTDARMFTFKTGIRTVVLYGGSNIKTQLYNLDKGADIVVATPGRLNDVLEKQKMKLFLTTFLVLDEADRMLDMGFSGQIRSIINDYDMPGNANDLKDRRNFNFSGSMATGNKLEYQKYCQEEMKRQTIMFSATFRKEIQVLAKEYLCNYTYLLVGKVGSTHEYIKQNVVYVEEEEKGNYVVKLLQENNNGLTLIFVETKRKANIVERFLNSKRLNAICIHGDKSQDERERALRLFKRGDKHILVATDVAARGLDVSNIKHVINFDVPNNIDDYIHRIGRTGRAGNIGIATSFVNENNKNIFRELLAILEECNQTIPSWFFNLVMKYTASARAVKGGGMRTGGGNGRYGNYNKNRNNHSGGFSSNQGGRGYYFNSSHNNHGGNNSGHYNSGSGAGALGRNTVFNRNNNYNNYGNNYRNNNMSNDGNANKPFESYRSQRNSSQDGGNDQGNNNEW